MCYCDNLYWNQEVIVKLQDENTKSVRILKGEKIGLSPLLFNIYSKFIFREIIKNSEKSSSMDKGLITLDAQMTQLSSRII